MENVGRTNWESMMTDLVHDAITGHNGAPTTDLSWKTGISTLHWCSITKKNNKYTAEFKEADVSLENDRNHKRSSTFDFIFNDNLLLPANNGQPLTMVISGPPGTGKTLLALEMCVRLTRNPGDVRALFFSNEMTYEAIERRIKQQELNPDDIGIDQFSSWSRNDKNRSGVYIRGRELPTRGELRQNVLDVVKDLAINSANLDFVPERRVLGKIYNIYKELLRRRRLSKPGSWFAGRARNSAEILVLDSLNTIPKEQRQEWFDSLLQHASGRIRLVIMIADTDGGEDPPIWDYVSDILIRMSRDYPAQYLQFSLEVLKARHQKHLLGKHQVKFVTPSTEPEHRDNETLDVWLNRCRHSFPYQKTGGLMIYPSIHAYLSVCRKELPHGPINPLSVLPHPLNRLVRFPKGRCTALIGARGGHKSHLAYLFGLSRIIPLPMKQNDGEDGFNSDDEAVVVVSLRDDEAKVRETMAKILTHEYAFKSKAVALEHLLEKELNGHLEILYFPPGYISSNEFFHRLLITISQLKQSRKHVTLIWNSLSQLGPRYPLCAAEPMFVPGILEILASMGITTVVVGMDAPEQQDDQYGLLPMADLILSFNPAMIPIYEYLAHLWVSADIAEKKERHIDSISIDERLPGLWKKQILSFAQSNSNRIELAEYMSYLVDMQPSDRKDNNIETGKKIILQMALEHGSKRVTRVRVEKWTGGHASGMSGILELCDFKNEDSTLNLNDQQVVDSLSFGDSADLSNNEIKERLMGNLTLPYVSPGAKFTILDSRLSSES